MKVTVRVVLSKVKNSATSAAAVIAIVENVKEPLVTAGNVHADYTPDVITTSVRAAEKLGAT